MQALVAQLPCSIIHLLVLWWIRVLVGSSPVWRRKSVNPSLRSAHEDGSHGPSSLYDRDISAGLGRGRTRSPVHNSRRVVVIIQQAEVSDAADDDFWCAGRLRCTSDNA